MLKGTRSVPTAQIAQDLIRDYEAILNFVHEIQYRCNGVAEREISDICEANVLSERPYCIRSARF